MQLELFEGRPDAPGQLLQKIVDARDFRRQGACARGARCHDVRRACVSTGSETSCEFIKS